VSDHSTPKTQRYSLKAACSNCNRYGTVDDQTLVCFHCGKTHQITAAETQQRDQDIALWMQKIPQTGHF
jgi:Fe2+ or Zn2+ uptake regulation protein